MKKQKCIRLSGSMALCLALVATGLWQGASAQVPDDPLDLVPPFTSPDNPLPMPEDQGLTPEDPDPRPYNELIDGLMPVHTDVPGLSLVNELEGDSCTLSVTTPENEGVGFWGRGTISCNVPIPHYLYLRVCLDRSVGGQWLEVTCWDRFSGSEKGQMSGEARIYCPMGFALRTRGLAVAIWQSGHWEPYRKESSSISGLNCF